jgi:predicted DNA-binding protein (UPF0251 family)
VAVFKPAGIRARDIDWLTLPLDEFEALRLVDREGLDQDQAAGRMGVSRPTVTRLLGRARRKIARVLCEGMALAIEGGPVVETPLPPGRGGGWGRGGGRGGGGRRFRGGRGRSAD